VEAVHKLETERDEQRDAQQQIREDGRASLCLQVLCQIYNSIDKTNDESHSEDGHANLSRALR